MMEFDIEKLIEECVFTAVRSSGSGGQNVNKVASKVVLSFDVNGSENLTELQKQLILKKMSNRISKNGVLQISSDSERTQWINKKAVTGKFRLLIREALKPERKRIATKPTFQSVQKRLDDKKRQSGKKRFRSGDFDV
ncbi:alternative ribosome rescue aminoacyl-tRNA hydrolase ArfB [Proteiniphilum sp.]|uniref:alternative ribosome rescue aminoacyl-tRNA hydrolase ArfB n=1 Tax=Proteiniphilum sp. TaxID=1926877 RepID=UPI0033262CE8